MELNDVLRRIVGQHWRLLTACLLGGITLGLLFAPHGTQYAASARLVLDTPDPVTRQQSEAIADTGRAIATSPSQVRRALDKAGVQRGDPAVFAKRHVALVALGSSGVLQLSVTDGDRQVAATVANALAKLVIGTRLAVSNGQTDRVLARLDQRTSELSRKIVAADEQLNSLTQQLAVATTSTDADALRTERDAAQSARDFLVQRRSVLESERVSLLSDSAQRPRPSIISAATPPGKPAPSHRMMYLVLGALLGLILGIGVAALVEAVRPTLVGSDALADELDSPLLGTVGASAAPSATVDIGARLRLAADAAHVGNVALLGTRSDVDLERLAESLQASAAVGDRKTPANTNGHGAALSIDAFRPEQPPINNGKLNGLVLVSPNALKRTELNDIAYLLKVSQLPLLGLITYAPSEGSTLHGVKSTIERLKATRRQ